MKKFKKIMIVNVLFLMFPYVCLASSVGLFNERGEPVDKKGRPVVLISSKGFVEFAKMSPCHAQAILNLPAAYLSAEELDFVGMLAASDTAQHAVLVAQKEAEMSNPACVQAGLKAESETTLPYMHFDPSLAKVSKGLFE